MGTDSLRDEFRPVNDEETHGAAVGLVVDEDPARLALRALAAA